MRSPDLIYQALTDVFRDVFFDDGIILRPDMTAKDIEGWDSISHINLLCAVEAIFGLRFSLREIQNLQKVDDIVQLILTRPE
jgi:acyl carrier protein